MNQHLSLNSVEDFFALYLVKKAPYTIPLHAREKIVAIVPWIDLILIIVFLPVLVALLGLNFVFYSSVWPIMGAHAYGWGLSTIISFVPFVLEVFAIYGLFKRKKYAWKLMMYASLLIIIENILFFSIGGILGGVIGLYILFQIKEYYK